jgi:hypothetical protein
MVQARVSGAEIIESDVYANCFEGVKDEVDQDRGDVFDTLSLEVLVGQTG